MPRHVEKVYTKVSLREHTSDASSVRIHAELIVGFILLLSSLACAGTSADFVRVIKSEHKLQIISNGKVLHEFRVALGGNPVGHKMQQGDGKTPEGIYLLDYKKADSAFYKAIHVSYPNASDMASAKARGVNPGGQIMIHGQKNGFGWLAPALQRFDWTDGCIAVSNNEMEVLWGLVKEGTAVEILP